MDILLGIDLGTSGVKVLAMERAGKILATTTRNYPLYQPRAGWSEQEPEDWWNGVVGAVRDLLQEQHIDAGAVRGLAVSGQMHGSVFLDDRQQVIRRPLLWNDTRTFPQCQTITETIGEERLIELAGNPALEGFTGPKVLWLKENEPEHYNRLATLLLPKDYILYRLTGRLCTEVSDAAGTLLFDVRNRKWSGQIMDLLDLKPSMLPEVLESPDTVGTLTAEAASATGLPAGVRVIAGGADNACSAVGNGIVSEGLVLASLGSSGTVVAYTAQMKSDPGGRIHSFNHAIPGRWYLMGVMLSAAASFQWFRDTFAEAETILARSLPDSAEHLLNRAAETVAPGSDGVMFLPYLSGERTPHRDAKARGVFFGLAPIHAKKHLTRAVMEGVAFGMRDSLELIQDLGITATQIRITGGGAKSPLWRQIIADVFDHPVVTTNIEEGPAIGAALLAGVGVGLFRDVEEAVRDIVEITGTTEPNASHAAIYRDLYPLYQRLYQSLKPEFAEAFDILERFNP